MSTHSASSCRFSVSLSDAFHNKQNLTGSKRAFSNYRTAEVTPGEFAHHILSGKAWAPCCFKDAHRRKTQFRASQLLALDLDEGVSFQTALSHDFIRQYAFLVHPSPSSTLEHPKSRVIFLLDEPVTQVSAWEALQYGLIEHFHELHPDKACKDAARMFYGSDVSGAVINEDAHLPLSVAGALTQPEATTEMERVMAARSLRKPTLKAKGQGRRGLSAELVTEVERQLGVLGAAVNSSGFTVDPIPCPMKQHEHDDEEPATYWHAEKKFAYCHKCHAVHLTKDIASALDIKRDPKRSQLGAKIIQCCLRFISDYDIASLLFLFNTLLIQSQTGSGKTEAIVKLLRNNPNSRVLIVVHRRWLAKSLVDRLNHSLAEQGVEQRFTYYENLQPAQLQAATCLVICINSLPKLVRRGHPAPVFDFVILDEISQQLTHLIGDTFKGQQAVNTYTILQDVIQAAKYVIGMDAYADELCLKWLSALRGEDNVTMLVNTYRQKKGDLTLHADFTQVIRRANELLLASQKGCVVFAVSSLAWTKILYSYYSGNMIVSEKTLRELRSDVNGRSLMEMIGGHFYDVIGLGPEVVKVINSETSSTLETQTFMNNINQELLSQRVLIYNSAMGTGVDIQAPVLAVFGLFSPDLLTADELHQMLARCRKAYEYHVCIAPHSHGRETSAQRLRERELGNADASGRLFDKRTTVSWEQDAQGRYQLVAQQRNFLNLWCSVKVRDNRSLNQLKAAFLRLAQDEYDIQDSSFSEEDSETELLGEELVTLRQAHKAIDKHLVLNSVPLDKKAFEHLQNSGQHTVEHIAGHMRWTIENGYRQAITPAIYDHSEDNGVAKLQLFIKVIQNPEMALQHDFTQDAIGYALPYRSYNTLKRTLIIEAFTRVWGPFESLDQLGLVSPQQINTRMNTFLQQHREELWRVFRWTRKHDTKPKNVLNRLLNAIGLKLEQKRSRRHKKYHVSPESLSVMQQYANVYLASNRGDLANDRAA